MITGSTSTGSKYGSSGGNGGGITCMEIVSVKINRLIDWSWWWCLVWLDGFFSNYTFSTLEHFMEWKIGWVCKCVWETVCSRKEEFLFLLYCFFLVGLLYSNFFSSFWNEMISSNNLKAAIRVCLYTPTMSTCCDGRERERCVYDHPPSTFFSLSLNMHHYLSGFGIQWVVSFSKEIPIL